jgi:hypothetical protein
MPPEIPDYAVDICFREIIHWPGDEHTNRRDSAFKASWFKTWRQLKRELALIDALDVEIHTWHGTGQRRKDGHPVSDRRPSSPGVMLTFRRLLYNDHTNLDEVTEFRFPCDTFGIWEDNLRAITLALEGLRMIDRFGVQTGAQYAGFRALPPAPNGQPKLTPEQAAQFILDNSGLDMTDTSPNLLLVNPDFRDIIYRKAAQRLHPDNKNGDQVQFQALEEAKRLLDSLQPQEA